MRKITLIAIFIASVNITTSFLMSQTKSPIERLVEIMTANPGDTPSLLFAERKPQDSQDIYDLATEHQELLKGVIHDKRTFAMLCVHRGYADVLERLINEGYPVDLATPCNLFGPNNPQTTTLHELLSAVRGFRACYFAAPPEDYKTSIIKLAKLIIEKYPDLLDAPVHLQDTARSYIQLNYLGVVWSDKKQ